MAADGRHVACELGFSAAAPVVLVLALAPSATAGELVSERLEVTGGEVVELPGRNGERMHVVRAGAGPLHVSYAASLRSAPQPIAAPGESVDLEQVIALRQSRFCPSDALAGFAAAEFKDQDPDVAAAVARWVFERFAYEPGSSGPLDTAVDTLLAGAGVCRDFAHLTIALCRALGVPARLAAVYAPGLSPMDFHAVVEARRAGRWEVHDPTRLAPRSSLVRIATGRDAADTAFATTLSGTVELVSAWISAVTDGDLPNDDHVSAVALP